MYAIEKFNSQYIENCCRTKLAMSYLNKYCSDQRTMNNLNQRYRKCFISFGVRQINFYKHKILQNQTDEALAVRQQQQCHQVRVTQDIKKAKKVKISDLKGDISEQREEEVSRRVVTVSHVAFGNNTNLVRVKQYFLKNRLNQTDGLGNKMFMKC